MREARVSSEIREAARSRFIVWVGERAGRATRLSHYRGDDLDIFSSWLTDDLAPQAARRCLDRKYLSELMVSLQENCYGDLKRIAL